MRYYRGSCVHWTFTRTRMICGKRAGRRKLQLLSFCLRSPPDILNFWHLKSPDGEICTVFTTFENCQAMSTAENLPSCREGYSLDVDAGFLTMTDPNPIDNESYEYVIFSYSSNAAYSPWPKKNLSHDRESDLQSTAQHGIQLLLAALFSLPTLSSPEGPLVQLPPLTTHVPCTKPLPNQNSQLNGNALHVLKVSSPSITIRKCGKMSSSRGSRDGGGKEGIGRRRRSGCTRCLLMPVRAFPGGRF